MDAMANNGKFKGTLEELQATVRNAGKNGTWDEPSPGQHRFRGDGEGIINWWPTKGTLLFQGKPPERDELEALLCGPGAPAPRLSPLPTPVPPAPAPASPPQQLELKPRRIFVVHGHDDHAREQLERILLILGLEPFVLANTSGAGMTIIEALEQQIGKSPEAEFGIVLMTPDDFGYSKRDGADAIKPRARQNVVLEMGMLIASLTRPRVVILVKGHLEAPSDANGIIYLNFNEHVKEVVPKLTERLRLAGFSLQPSAISRAAS